MLCVLGLIVVALRDDSDEVLTPQARQEEPDGNNRPPTGRQPIELTTNLSTTRAALPSAVEVIELARSAVVTVISSNSSQFDEAGTVLTGTGFIVDRNGYIVTNAHVVAGGESYLVVFADGQEAEGELIGADPISDLAVIKVGVAVPSVAPLGDSNALRAGQPVLAIGSPLGELTNTVTQGIVSALGRSLAAEPGRPALSGLVQHDAAINPGNSGGPLLNFAGEVIGINTLGIQQAENGELAQGLFFAIPSNTVRQIATRLIQDGDVEYPFLGVESLPITPEVAARNDLPIDHGEYVVSVVDDGPADEADIREGDVLLSIDGETINQGRPFTEVLFAHAVGESVTLDVFRDGDTIEIEVVLGSRPAADS
jgi:2-alkenal reductase